MTDEEKVEALHKGLYMFAAQLKAAQKTTDQTIRNLVAERGLEMMEAIREVCSILTKENTNG